MRKLKTRKKTADCISYKSGGKGAQEDHNEEWQETGEEIRHTLQNIGTRIEAPDSLKQRIDFRITEKLEKEEHKMKHMSMKKIVLGVAAASALIGTIAVAGSGIISYSSHSSSVPDYTKFEDMGKAESEIGYSVDAVESFSNGFVFDGIRIIEDTLEDESGQIAGQEKSLGISYSKGTERMDLYARKLLAIENGSVSGDDEWDKTIQAGDVTVGYTQSTYKAVPPDYEPTEEDKKAQESGRLQIGYGSEKVEVSQYSYAGWIKDGIQYSLSGFDVSVNGDEMLNMAREIIENSN